MDHADPEPEVCPEPLLYRIRRKGFGLSLINAPGFWYRLEKFESADALIKALDEYIEYDNNHRIKSHLNGKGPVLNQTFSFIG